MIWYIISVIAFAAAIGLLVYTRMRDRRYEELKTSQAMGRELWSEIEEERQASLARRDKFQSAVKEAEGKEGGNA